MRLSSDAAADCSGVGRKQEYVVGRTIDGSLDEVLECGLGRWPVFLRERERQSAAVARASVGLEAALRAADECLTWHGRSAGLLWPVAATERSTEFEPKLVRDVAVWLDNGRRFRQKSEQTLVYRFEILREQWVRDTGMYSKVRDMAMHPAYQQIIGLGPAAVPLILRELQERPAFWFWALTAITGEDPAAGKDKFETARRAWLEWGEKEGYLPQAA